MVTVGSSAGGYAAILYGSLLKAKRVIAFNAQFSLSHLVEDANVNSNPLVYKYKTTERVKYFELKKFLLSSVNYWYFLSENCQDDKEQYSKLFAPTYPPTSLKCLKFKTAHHGIPFLKVALNKVLSLDDSELSKYTTGANHPITFTIKMVGIKNTFIGFLEQVYKAYKKRK